MKQTNAAAITPLFMSVGEARVRLGGLADSTIRDLVRNGVLDGRKAGSRLLITTASIDAYAANLPRAGQEG